MTATKEKTAFMHGRDKDFTEEEYDALMREMLAAHSRKDMAEFFRLGEQLPLDANIAKAVRDVYGSRFIRESGLDVTEAEIKWSKDWLNDGPEEGIFAYAYPGKP